MPGQTTERERNTSECLTPVCVCVCELEGFRVITYLHACDVSGVEAITHQHNQGISGATQDSDCLRMSHTKETVIAHLQDSHTHFQAAISCCGTARAHLNTTQIYVTL